MAKKKEDCCDANASACCNVEAIVSIDDRGQMVLPKDLREDAGIKPGDKLAIIASRSEGKICCMVLVPSKDLGNGVKVVLGPMVKEMTSD